MNQVYHYKLYKKKLFCYIIFPKKQYKAAQGILL